MKRTRSNKCPRAIAFFARNIELPAKTIRKALFSRLRRRSSRSLRQRQRRGRGFDFHKPQMLEVTTLLHGGENTLGIKAHNASGPAGVVGRLMVWFEERANR